MKKGPFFVKPKCHDAIKERLYSFGTFDIMDNHQLHSSRTVCVFKMIHFEKYPVSGNDDKENKILSIPTTLKCTSDIDLLRMMKKTCSL